MKAKSCADSSQLRSYWTFGNKLVRKIPLNCHTFWLRLHYRYWEIMNSNFYTENTVAMIKKKKKNQKKNQKTKKQKTKNIIHLLG